MARAVSETVVKEIDKDALLGFLKNSPQTAFNMMQQLASYARNANEKLSVDAFSSDSDSSNNEVGNENKVLSYEEKKRQEKNKMMNQLLDEFDDDIDRIKSSHVPKSVKYSVYSFGFLIIFLPFAVVIFDRKPKNRTIEIRDLFDNVCFVIIKN